MVSCSFQSSCCRSGRRSSGGPWPHRRSMRHQASARPFPIVGCHGYKHGFPRHSLRPRRAHLSRARQEKCTVAPRTLRSLLATSTRWAWSGVSMAIAVTATGALRLIRTCCKLVCYLQAATTRWSMAQCQNNIQSGYTSYLQQVRTLLARLLEKIETVEGDHELRSGFVKSG
jgi:hypothetical protein